MHGTWKVTGGGGGGGAVLVIAMAAAAAEGVAWVLAHIWWILGTGAACAVLTGVAVARLMRWSDERAARVWAQRPAQLRAEPVTQLPREQRPAIAPQVVNFNFYGADAARAAAVIRRVLPGGGDDDGRGSL